MLKQITRKLRLKDGLAPKAMSLFHYENGFNQKTTYGGILSITISLYIYWVIFYQLYRMLWLVDPYFGSVEKDLEKPEAVVQLNDTTILALSLIDYTFTS